MKAPCKCSHAGQDSLHGKGVRIFNKTANSSHTSKKYKVGIYNYRCTVCGNGLKID